MMLPSSTRGPGSSSLAPLGRFCRCARCHAIVVCVIATAFVHTIRPQGGQFPLTSPAQITQHLVSHTPCPRQCGVTKLEAHRYSRKRKRIEACQCDESTEPRGDTRNAYCLQGTPPKPLPSFFFFFFTHTLHYQIANVPNMPSHPSHSIPERYWMWLQQLLSQGSPGTRLTASYMRQVLAPLSPQVQLV